MISVARGQNLTSVKALFLFPDDSLDISIPLALFAKEDFSNALEAIVRCKYTADQLLQSRSDVGKTQGPSL